MTEETHKVYANEVCQALGQKVGFGVVTTNLSVGQLRVVGRIPQGNIPTWLAVM